MNRSTARLIAGALTSGERDNWARNATDAPSFNFSRDLPVKKWNCGAMMRISSPSRRTPSDWAARPSASGAPKPAMSHQRLVTFFIRCVCSSIIHTDHESRGHAPSFDRESHGHHKRILAQAHAERVPRYRILPLVPNRAGIVKDVEHAVAIVEGVIRHAAAAQRIQVILVSAPQHGAGSQHVALEQWRATRDQAGDSLIGEALTPARDSIAHRPAMPRIGEIAVEHSSGCAQAVAGLQFVLIGSPSLDAPRIA